MSESASQNRVLHESGPYRQGQVYTWTRTLLRRGVRIRLILVVDAIEAQSRIRSEVWLAGRGWREVLSYHPRDFGDDSLPNPYGSSEEIKRIRAGLILRWMEVDVLGFLGQPVGPDGLL